MARIGVLGGSFDPIHNGHLAVASQVQQKLALDQVLFVPTGNQWQKSSASSPTDRVAMASLAISGIAGFRVSTVDVDRAGPTYSVDTLTDLQVQFPGDELFFIVGADALAGMPSWKNYDQLPQLAKIIAVARPGVQLQVPSLLVGKVDIVEVETPNVSSTHCRQLAADGESLLGLMPEAAIEYLHSHELYQKVTMTPTPLTRREARDLERRRQTLELNGHLAEDPDLPRTGPIEVVPDTQSNSLVLESVPDVSNMMLVLPDSGALLKTGAIDLPVIKADTGQMAVIEAAESADLQRETEQKEQAVSGIEPIPARVHQRTRRRSSVFPTRLRQGWGVVHLVLISSFILLAIFSALLAAVLLGLIKLF